MMGWSYGLDCHSFQFSFFWYVHVSHPVFPCPLATAGCSARGGGDLLTNAINASTASLKSLSEIGPSGKMLLATVPPPTPPNVGGGERPDEVRPKRRMPPFLGNCSRFPPRTIQALFFTLLLVPGARGCQGLRVGAVEGRRRGAVEPLQQAGGHRRLGFFFIRSDTLPVWG